METALFNHPRVRQILTLVFLPAAVTCIFPPNTPIFQWWAQQSVGVALGYVALGLLFLFFNNSRLMFVCLGCGAVISFNSHEKAMRSLNRQDMLHRQGQWNIQYVAPAPGELSYYLPPHVATPPRR